MRIVCEYGLTRIVYEYEDKRGRVLLRKWRSTVTDDFPNIPKKFSMEARSREGWRWVNPTDLERKYPGAHDYFHSLLYNLPLLLADPAEVWLTEGEKDAAALVRAGLAALSHWQGAQNFTEGQAEQFRRYRGRVVLAADADAAGAADVVRRYDLLRAVGIPEDRIRLVVAAPGLKDAHDHLAAGHSVAEFREMPLEVVRKFGRRAPAHTPGRGKRGYDPGPPISTWRAKAETDAERDARVASKAANKAAKKATPKATPKAGRGAS